MDSNQFDKYKTLLEEELPKGASTSFVKNIMLGMLFLGGFLLTVEGIKFLSAKNSVYEYQKSCLKQASESVLKRSDLWHNDMRKAEVWKICR